MAPPNFFMKAAAAFLAAMLYYILYNVRAPTRENLAQKNM